MSDVPSQPVPHHDDFEKLPAASVPQPEAEPEPAFVRPPSKEIDFARVIRRSDLSRAATRTCLVSTGIAGLVLIVYLITNSPVILGMVIAFGLIAVVAGGVRIRLATAPIPHLER